MALANLRVQHLRIIAGAELSPSPRLNLVYGENATGKTSLLEAVDVLSRGRSFRTHLLSDLLSHGQPQLIVTATLAGEARRIIGIERSKAGTRMRVQGRAAASIAELATELPVQVLHPDSHQLVGGAPALRRAYMDWGVFHSRSRYLDVWRRYSRALKQRNAMLKMGSSGDSAAWDGELAQTAAELDQQRRAYVERLEGLIKAYGERLLATADIDVGYRRGWPDEFPLAQALADSAVQDRERGYTRHGPHRAELNIKLSGHAAMHTASRGQQKLLAAALRLAQARLFSEEANRVCTFLVDDLPSELDHGHRVALLSALADLDAQVFISAIDPDELET
ncbi:MAG: DNA replication/repair protein RecF, partial [Gammaproteobacteria bacterium]